VSKKGFRFVVGQLQRPVENHNARLDAAVTCRGSAQTWLGLAEYGNDILHGRGHKAKLRFLYKSQPIPSISPDLSDCIRPGKGTLTALRSCLHTVANKEFIVALLRISVHKPLKTDFLKPVQHPLAARSFMEWRNLFDWVPLNLLVRYQESLH
jgi:hypothetical protein